MKYTIERLSFEELAAFLKIQAEDAFPDLKDELRLNTLAEKWSTNADICTCRDDDNGLIGMIAFYANRPEDLVLYIPHVYVKTDYRGQSIFKTMLNQVEKYVKEKGFQLLRLEVKKTNIIAQKAYLSHGFYPVSDTCDDSYYLQYNVI